MSLGVPQGTILGSLIFQIYINDIIENVSSQLNIFADDSLLHRVITTEEHFIALQKDLDILTEWVDTWQMNFNPSTCAVS